MKEIRLQYDFVNESNHPIIPAMRKFHQQHLYINGFDHEDEYYWAQLTDEQFLLFALTYPDLTRYFKDV